MFEQNIFRILADWQAEGLKTGLATLVHIDGSSPRPLGAQIGVAEDGRHCGVISSGCAEDAFIEETLRHIEGNSSQITRYGKGSPYIDVTLPCGSGLDILFNGDAANATAQATALHSQRKPAFVTVNDDHQLSVSSENSKTAFCYPPDYVMHVFGAGPQMVYFAQLAKTLGYKLDLHSTDEATIATLESDNISVSQMTHRTRFEPNLFDEYSSVITLFHEHNLELNILHNALDSKAHFIGAMGSKKTHAQRADLLAMQPPTLRPFDDIHGPVGLDIGAADPAEIALSILAQIVEVRRKQSNA